MVEPLLNTVRLFVSAIFNAASSSTFFSLGIYLGFRPLVLKGTGLFWFRTPPLSTAPLQSGEVGPPI